MQEFVYQMLVEFVHLGRTNPREFGKLGLEAAKLLLSRTVSSRYEDLLS
jgi:hypothetical protein